MDPKIIETIERCAAASYTATISFRDVIAALVGQGIESYRVDYRTRLAHYYLASGDTHTLAVKAPVVTIGDAFSPATLQEAIAGSQRGEVTYPEFLERSMAAGCVGYVVWIAGRHVAYFGRRGETHIERFPSVST